MSDVEIKVNFNGSLLVRGPFRLIDGNGDEYDVKKEVVAFCRCGQSSKKPFCDSTHKHHGFQACETAPELNARLAAAEAAAEES